MQTFLGNILECNGRAQLAFGIPQRVNGSATGSGWDISSDGTLVGVMLADRCMAVAKPNTLAGYTGGGNQANGLAITPGGTTAGGVSVIDVKAFGVIWQSTTLASGTDYSAALAAAPQGNGNAGDPANWGVCPTAAAVTCPVALAP